MTMGKRIAIGLFALLVCAVGIKFANSFPAAVPAPQKAISTVWVENTTGHGSGVHIGHGYIITAAHVVDAEPIVKIVDTNGLKQDGTVLWTNKSYDLALVHIETATAIASSPVNCMVRPRVGDSVSAIGNPLNLKFIQMWGRIAAPVADRSNWKAAFIADITIAPGMSGGPLFDKAGNLIGFAVGVSSMSLGLGTVLFPISYIVPVSAACHLMAKA
jgi:S1-C subfamily serine protease